MASKEVQITEEELQSLNRVESEYHLRTKECGELEFEIQVLSRRLSGILESFPALHDEKEKVLADLNTKYGNGYLDIKTGTMVLEVPDTEDHTN